MKKLTILTIIPLALSLAACSGLEPEDQFIGEGEGISNYAEITARIAGAPATKTGMGSIQGTSPNQTYPVVWSENDQIGLISDEGLSVFTITGGQETTVATFGGDASKVVGTFPGTSVYPAAYPASDAFAERYGQYVWVGSELPAIQTYAENSFADNVYPMAAATANSSNYDFYNMAGVIQLDIKFSEIIVEGDDPITITEGKIRQLTFNGNNGEKVAGGVAMKFDAQTGAFVSTEAGGWDNGKAISLDYGDSYSTIIMDFSGLEGGGLTINSTGYVTVNIPVLPQTFEKGFTVKLQDASNMGTRTYVTKTDDIITIRRSELKTMDPIVFERPEALSIANSYLITEAGEYLLPAYAYGNRMDIRIFPKDYDQNNIDAAIFWTDIVDETGNMKEGALTDLQYLKFSDGINYIRFKAGEYKGNVVIALYDTKQKTIFWTWHIWLTDQPQNVVTGGTCGNGTYQGIYPDGTTFNFNAESASGNMVIMDRNLGAIHATPAECDTDESGNPKVYQTYGLYFEDGRKDPFIGSNIVGSPAPEGYSRVEYKNDAQVQKPYVFEDTPFGTATAPTWVNPIFKQPWRFQAGFITLTQSVRNTTMFSSAYTIKGNPQWTLYTDPDNKAWMDPSVSSTASHGRTGLTDGGHEAYWNRTKTIMDPCPPGYSVLGAYNDKSHYYGKDTITASNTDAAGYGIWTHHTYDGVTYDTWWPAAGVRARDGRMAGMGEFGAYFFYDHIKESHGGHGFAFKITSSGSQILESGGGPITGHATPIRCVREKQLSEPVNPTPIAETSSVLFQ